MGIVRKDKIVMYYKLGFYRILIGIFRSELCLDCIKRLMKLNSEKDNEFMDFFIFFDDIFRNFEMVEFL